MWSVDFHEVEEVVWLGNMLSFCWRRLNVGSQFGGGPSLADQVLLDSFELTITATPLQLEARVECRGCRVDIVLLKWGQAFLH